LTKTTNEENERVGVFEKQRCVKAVWT